MKRLKIYTDDQWEVDLNWMEARIIEMRMKVTRQLFDENTSQAWDTVNHRLDQLHEMLDRQVVRVAEYQFHGNKSTK